MEGAAWVAAGAEVDEVDAAPAHCRVPPHRIAPIGISSIGHDVAGGENVRQVVERAIDRVACRDVKKNNARSSERARQRLEAVRRHHACGLQFGGKSALGVPRDAESLAQCLPGEIAAHFAEADDSKFR